MEESWGSGIQDFENFRNPELLNSWTPTSRGLEKAGIVEFRNLGFGELGIQDPRNPVVQEFGNLRIPEFLISWTHRFLHSKSSSSWFTDYLDPWMLGFGNSGMWGLKMQECRISWTPTSRDPGVQERGSKNLGAKLSRNWRVPVFLSSWALGTLYYWIACIKKYFVYVYIYIWMDIMER